MQKFIVFIAILVLFNVGTLAQNPTQTQSAADAEAEARRRTIREEDARRKRQEDFNRLNSVSEQSYRGKMVPTVILQDVRDLYRGPSAMETKSLQPASEDIEQYRSFLSRKRTGIVRLVEDAGCGDSIRTVSAIAECVKYSMPGNGSWYSFRETSYRLGRLADLGFVNGNFVVAGVWQHSIMAGIGDIPIDNVGTETKGLQYLSDFRPVSEMSDAAIIDTELKKPTERNGYLYSNQLRAVTSMTYVLRSVAYRGQVYRSIGGIPYNELDFDNRMDITVAFRIIRRHEDGSITIVWRELDRKKSPVLKPAKSDPGNRYAGKFA